MKNHKINVQEMYNGFEKGTDMDSDFLARCAGFFDNDPVVISQTSLELHGQFYDMIIKYVSNGDQKILETDCFVVADVINHKEQTNYSEDFVSLSLSNARKYKATDKEQLKFLSLFHKHFTELIDDCSWFEGVIQITDKTSNKVIIDDFEGDLGLDGVYGSVQDILDREAQENYHEEILEFILFPE